MLKRAFVIIFAVVLNVAGSAFADEVVDGKVGDSLYRLVRPANWNGRLVLYAHGFVPSDAPVVLPPEGSLLISLLAPQGCAVAYSSFSENGWAVKDGTERTHQLLGIFSARFGRPARVYITGVSMGGLIAIRLSETYPGIYAGALPAGAVAGGPRRQFDYEANIWTLFDFLYPEVLPSDAANVPEGIDVTQAVVLPALAAMQANPDGALAMAQIDQIPIPFATSAELVESILTALAYYATEFTDLSGRTHGHGFLDNSGTQYTGALSPRRASGDQCRYSALYRISECVDLPAALLQSLGCAPHPDADTRNVTRSGRSGLPPDFIQGRRHRCRRVRFSRSARGRAIWSPQLYS